MEASARIIHSSALPRLSPSFLNRRTDCFKLSSAISRPSSFLYISSRPNSCHSALRLNPHSCTRILSSIHRSNSSPSPFSHSLSASHSLFATRNFYRLPPNSKDKFFRWSFATEGVNGREMGIFGDKGPAVTAVLLGWLGAKPKHLNRYVELYNSRGIHAVTFVISVRDALGFDLGRKIEEQLSELTQELASWLAQDGRERFLLFHTFSNTGWLAYGAILELLHGKEDLLGKIKGCVVDSGGDPELNPRVWAAGFTTALLKKRNSSVYPPTEAGEEMEAAATSSNLQQNEPSLVETFFLLAFEKFFTAFLNLPYVNQRLTNIVSILSDDQPPCPQLYLYSTADKVIPSRSVESFIADQQRKGRKVWSFNFGSSPHVDHLRTFQALYSLQLENFLKECLVTVRQT